MKVRVVLTIDVDEQEWRAQYDDPQMPAAEIRRSVKSAVATAAATPGVVVPDGIIRDVTVEGGDL